MKPSPSLFYITQTSTLLTLLIAQPTTAQIIPDNTVNTTVTPNGNINVIEGGTRAGNNLFHSFQEFSIPTGREAFFNNGLDIQNIFSRVTGRSISNIDGLIRANGIANLFLLNPNGIIFGPNARLNIGGSFLATTANSFKFADGSEFSATNPQAAPLLSVNVPIGLQYGKNAAEIRVQGKGQDLGFATESFDSSLNPLEVLPGKTLTFVGGNVVVDGGILQAPGGRVEIGGIAGEGTVGLNADGSLSFPEGVTLSDISISNKAGINVIASGGGSITITGRNLDISGESLLTAGIARGKGSVGAVAGDISLNATKLINISSSRIDNLVYGADGTGVSTIGNSGEIIFETGSLLLTGGAVVAASTVGQGDAGNVSINATDIVWFDGESRAVSTVEAGAIGNGGEVEITTGSFFLTNGAQLNVSTYGQGDAGNVNIIATGIILFDGVGSNGFFSGVGSIVQPGAIGKGGNINITAKSLGLTNGALLIASTGGKGDAGNVSISATDTVLFDGVGSNGRSSTAFSTVEAGAIGKGGDINITTGSLRVKGGAQLNASTYAQGDAGNVNIIATDTVWFDGVGSNGLPSGAGSTVQSGAIGKGGDVEITTGSLLVTNGAQLQAASRGQGDAGNVKITATDTVLFDGVGSNGLPSAALSTVEAGAIGKGGDVEITAGSLLVTNGAQLQAASRGQGDAGNVKITATDTVLFDGVGSNGLPSAALSAVGEGAIGKGGDINITAKSLGLTNGALLIASTAGKGDAGNVSINATDRVLFDGVGSNGRSSTAFSTVEAGAIGKGGDVEIITGSLFLTNGAQLNVSTYAQGDAGNVNIIATGIILFDGVGSNGLPSGAGSTVQSGAIGKGGNINITTKSLGLTNGALLIASTGGKGDAGNVSIDATYTVLLDGDSRVWSTVQPGAIGKGGNINITAKSLGLTNGASLIASTLGEGDAGNVSIDATDTVLFDGVGSNGQSSTAFSTVEAGAIGKGGNIDITTGSLRVKGGAQLNASTYAEGNAGNVSISATDTVLFEGVGSNGLPSAAGSIVQSGAIGRGGDISITTKSLTVTDGAKLLASTVGQGDAGNVSINATDRVLFDGVGSNGQSSTAFSTVEAGAIGNGGEVEITTGSLFVKNGAQLNASTYAQGNAGNVKIIATDTVLFEGVGSNGLPSAAGSIVQSGAIGKGGDIEITTGSLSVTGGALLSVLSAGQGDAGNVRISATDTVLFDGVGSNGFPSSAFSTVEAGGIGKGGDVEITAGSLFVTNGAQLQAASRGQGDAGNVKITATDTVLFDGVGSNGFFSGVASTVEAGGIGKGGSVEITTGSLLVTNGAQLQAASRGQGVAGNVKITATDTVLFDGVGSNGLSSGVASTVEAGAIGKGGDVEITAESLLVKNGAQLQAASRGQGNAGNVKITATDTVLFDGVGSNGKSSGAFSSVQPGAVGKGGSIDITTKSLSVTGGALLSVLSAGQGDAGNVRISTTDTVLFDGVGSNGLPSGAFSAVGEGVVGKGGDISITTKSLSVTGGALLLTSTIGQGDAGNINITAHSLSVTDGALLIASTLGKGDAGNVNITVTDTVLFDGVSSDGIPSAAGSTVEADAVGNGGSINITTRSLSFTNGAGLTADSIGNGAAGNINIKANSIRLSNEALIIANTVQGQGNITMESQSLIMRRGSKITTNATGKATGGNITINTDVLAALENSDISANAEDSFGGRVIINAQGIFGTKFRPENTPQSDITATSKLGPQFSGTVEINTPAVDPSSGLVNLPDNAVDVSRLVPKGCVARRKETGTFYITGNGGFQYRPGDGLVSPLPTGEVRSIPEDNSSSKSQVNERIIEAQGIYKLENGEMVLGWECPE